MTVRVRLAEHAGLGGGSQVSVQHHQVVVALSGQLLQGVAVAFTGSDLFHVCILLLLLFQRGVGGVQFFHSDLVFVVVGALAVPVHGVAHKGNALALGGVHDDAGGLVVLGMESLDGGLACRYCFAEEGEYHGRRALMSFEVGKKALDFLIANSGSRKNLEVDFFGGELL